jgi:hypothetical protein
MYHVSLPSLIASGENKGKPSVVEITSAKLTAKQIIDGVEKDVPVKFSIPAEKFKYPQFGPQPAEKKNDKGEVVGEEELSVDQAKQGIDEAIKDAGGEVRFLENYNDATRQAALNKGKNYIRTKETGAPDDIVEAGLKMSTEFTWAAAERVTNKQVRQEVEAIIADIDNIPQDELKRRLLAMMGKKP